MSCWSTAGSCATSAAILMPPWRTWRRRSDWATSVVGVHGPGGRLPQARPVRRRHSTSSVGRSRIGPTRRPFTASEPTWSSSKAPTPAQRRRRSPTWIGRSGWRSRTTACWRATTPSAAACWRPRVATSRPWRPAMPRSRQVRDYEEAHRLRLDVLLRLKRHDDVIRSCDALIAGERHRPRSTNGVPWPAS